MKDKFENILKVVQQLDELQKASAVQILDMYSTEVETIILSKSKDKKRIEKALDTLVDFAFDDKVLVIFKKLCRYFYYIDEEATIFYVNLYRELWDEDSLEH